MAERQPRTDQQRKDKSQAEEGAHDLRLAALLNDLVRSHTHKGAARELGVGYKTILRFKGSGKLTEALRLALERYLLGGPEAPDSQWWRRFSGLESRMQALEASVSDVREVVRQTERRLASERERFEKDLAEMERRVVFIEKKIDDLPRPAEDLAGQEDRTKSLPRDSASDHQVSDGGPLLRPTSGTPRGADDVERSEVIRAWHEAVVAERKARTELERARAAERRLQLELDLLQDYKASVPPGESWDDTRRAREVAWRWDALDDRRRERRRLEIRRWIRRVLTLGLWWA